jgi:hypothetical protein
MKLVLALISAIVSGPCSSVAGDTASAPSSAAVPAAAASTTAAAATAVAAVPVETLPQAGPCALLAQKCGRCPRGVVQTACNAALTAGALDPASCTNALNDKDIKAQCSGGGAPARPSPAPPAAPPPATPTTTATPTGVGPCAELAKKCPRCASGLVQSACNVALSAGSLDPASCTNALNDKDIKRLCN